MAQTNWTQVKEVFHEALRHNSAEREEFLTVACRDDINLRIEVESLLISLTEAQHFLERPVIGERPVPNDSWLLENDQCISHYRIVEPIGTGGMGEVYLAEDMSLHRNVALKILPDTVISVPDRLRRFQREAQVVSALNHPNIVTIFEFGKEGDIQFIACEYIKGETLRSRLQGVKLTIAETLEIGIQIVSALQGAHGAGVTHRDIKPENVMIRDDGYVKILDFGLAKLTEPTRAEPEADTQEQIFSQPGMLMGTVTYMSPEQVRSRPIDHRSDLFSFGIVLFEMLTGRAPFRGDTMTDVIAAILQADPPRPSRFNKNVPPDFDRIVEKLLEKSRSERFQSAAEVLSDLKRLKKRSDINTVSGNFPTSKLAVSDLVPATDSEGVRRESRKTVTIIAVIAVMVILAVFAAYFLRKALIL